MSPRRTEALHQVGHRQHLGAVVLIGFQGGDFGGETVVLFLFWLVLTESLAPFDLVVGAVFSVLLALWTVRFLWPEDAPVLSAKQAGRFLLYCPRARCLLRYAHRRLQVRVRKGNKPLARV